MSWLSRTKQDGGDDQPPDDISPLVRSRADQFIADLDGSAASVGSGDLDYTPASLSALDRLLDRFHAEGAAAPPDVVLGAASYLMEVARSEHGGVYQSFNDADPLVLVVQHSHGTVGLLATSKVQGRIENGPEDDIPFFYEGFVQAIRDERNATIC